MSVTKGKFDQSCLDWLEARLEEAGATLLALPQGGMGPRLRQVRWPEIREGEDGIEVSSGRRLRGAIPGGLEIGRMDEALGWIGLIPRDRVVLRRILHARSLVSPLTGKHIYSWRKLAALLGADHKAVQRWHLDGLKLVLMALKDLGKNTLQNDPR